METISKVQSNARVTFTGDEEYVQGLMTAWENYVSKETEVTSLFLRTGGITGTQKLHGYGMPFADYAALIGSPNCHKFKIRYGCDLAAPANEFKFKVIIYGVDEQGTRVSAYCIPELVTTERSPIILGNGPGSGLVAPQLANLWLDNWGSLETFSSDIFKVAVYHGEGVPNTIEVLRGYNFSADDFHQVIEVHSSAIDCVYTFMVVHEIVPAEASEASLLFGNMIGSTDSNNAVISNFYDLSTPCPDTC